jgi:hypothetical protein
MKIVTFKGSGPFASATHYLVMSKPPAPPFNLVVGRDERLMIPDDVYDILKTNGHIGEGKLQDVTPAEPDLDNIKSSWKVG